MIQLCYISTARPIVSTSMVETVLDISRRNNKRVSVTGLLLYNGKRFLQLLEGPDQAVRETYAQIEKDDRHFAIVKLSERAIDAREFGDWDMAFERFPDDRNRLKIGEQVAQLTHAASANVRALFTSYAAI